MSYKRENIKKRLASNISFSEEDEDEAEAEASSDSFVATEVSKPGLVSRKLLVCLGSWLEKIIRTRLDLPPLLARLLYHKQEKLL